jgi:formylglycine-generating enzyme required for sulfatase activity
LPATELDGPNLNRTRTELEWRFAVKKLLIPSLFLNALLLAGHVFHQLSQEASAERGRGAESPSWAGDLNCDGYTDISDAVLLLEYLFSGGPRPCAPPPPPPPTIPGFTFLEYNVQGYPEYSHDRTGIIFVRLPGGAFEMGPNHFCIGPGEIPRHEVTLSPFLIAKYEVTQEQYEAVMGSNPSEYPGVDRPVEKVSWEDCKTFCNETGLALPTEAQWEYACRAGTSTPFSCGEELTHLYANFNGLEAYCGQDPDGQYLGETVIVGTRLPNGFGLHDMHGNVLEWCEDVYDAEFYSNPAAVGPDPVSTSGSVFRVNRGGCYSFDPRNCRSGARHWNVPSSFNGCTGFRPARPLP